MLCVVVSIPDSENFTVPSGATVYSKSYEVIFPPVAGHLDDLRTREEIINRTITKGIPKDDLETFNRVLEQMKKNVYDLINKF